ncbi:hypothetical protein PV721_11960, partial [Streptomyces sp. MB09-01]|nr:hypothetical protein [Streptomyces sp. MB09-01]
SPPAPPPTRAHVLSRDRVAAATPPSALAGARVLLFDSPHVAAELVQWWGDHYELCPDDLLVELNGAADHAKITALLKRYGAQKR